MTTDAGEWGGGSADWFTATGQTRVLQVMRMPTRWSVQCGCSEHGVTQDIHALTDLWTSQLFNHVQPSPCLWHMWPVEVVDNCCLPTWCLGRYDFGTCWHSLEFQICTDSASTWTGGRDQQMTFKARCAKSRDTFNRPQASLYKGPAPPPTRKKTKEGLTFHLLPTARVARAPSRSSARRFCGPPSGSKASYTTAPGMERAFVRLPWLSSMG